MAERPLHGALAVEFAASAPASLGDVTVSQWLSRCYDLVTTPMLCAREGLPVFEIVYRCDPVGSPAPPRPTDAQEVQERLVEGNKRFATLIKGSTDPSISNQEVIPISLAALGIAEDSSGVPRQQPFAAVLSCSDARVPVELIFHQGCNDLFVVRLAGNVVTNECAGSIGYSLRHLDESVKLVVVLGHTHCGAVTAAVDSYVHPESYSEITSALGMKSIIDRAIVSVRSGAQALERLGVTQASDENKFREQLLNLSVVLNSAMMAMLLKQVVSEVASVKCPVVYGVYDLVSRTVWAPDVESSSRPWLESRLADPPTSAREFESLADRLAGAIQVES